MHQIIANTLACYGILLINIFNAQLICTLLICIFIFSKLQKFLIDYYKSSYIVTLIAVSFLSFVAHLDKYQLYQKVALVYS